MSTECTFTALAQLDRNDIDAVQQMLDGCVAMLLSPDLWIWAIVVSALFAVIAGIIGWQRGRPWAGVFWGLVLGPIGCIVAARLRPAGAAPTTPSSTD